MFFAPAIRARAFTPARSLDRSFERFLSEAFAAPAFSGAQFDQSDDAWTLALDVPGVTREHLSIDIDRTAVRVQTSQEAPRQYKIAYELPAEIDAEASSAKLENGVLTLTLGKKKAAETARRIEVQ
jgi:HSP20 family protein